MALVDARPAIRAHLLADLAISNIVGTRIFPIQLPQGVIQPSIVYHVIDETEGYHYSGPDGLVAQRLQIDAVSRSSDEAINISTLCKERLGGFAGVIAYGTNSPQDTVEVQLIQFLTTQPEDYDNDLALYTKRRDYMVWFVERI